VKNKGFKEEEKHLVEVQSKFDAKIQSEKQRLKDEHLDQQRQDFIDFSIHQLSPLLVQNLRRGREANLQTLNLFNSFGSNNSLILGTPQ